MSRELHRAEQQQYISRHIWTKRWRQNHSSENMWTLCIDGMRIFHRIKVVVVVVVVVLMVLVCRDGGSSSTGSGGSRL